MRWTSTSKTSVVARSWGFTLIELLVGLALVLTITAAVLPLWSSFERMGARAADDAVQSLQGRVAIGRLERDLRLASASGCPFVVSSPILEASASQIVFLERTSEGGALNLVEWEIVNGALMRRWGVCPAARPAVFKHTLYLDHKTMLENVAPESRFEYVVGGVRTAPPISVEHLEKIEAVVFEAESVSGTSVGSIGTKTTARVAR